MFTTTNDGYFEFYGEDEFNFGEFIEILPQREEYYPYISSIRKFCIPCVDARYIYDKDYCEF